MGGLVSRALSFLPGANIVSWLLGVPVWVWITLGLLASHGYAIHYGRDIERAAGESAALSKRVAQLEAKQKADEEIIQFVNDQAESTMIENRRLEQKVREYEKSACEGDDCCPLTFDPDERLRELQK